MTQRYCTICTKEITDARRLGYDLPYCSDDCQLVDSRERRAQLALRRCELRQEHLSQADGCCG